MLETGYVIFLNGAYGVGKTSVLDHVGDLLAEARRPFSLMDVDWFHRSWPPAHDDHRNVLTEADNMAAVWANYLRAGPRQLVVSGVLATADDRERYERALRLPVRSIRLEASPAVMAWRLQRRYTQAQNLSYQWHLDRHEDLAELLRTADLDELAIATDDQTPRAIAEQVLGHFQLCCADPP